jgi:hypothetical protein
MYQLLFLIRPFFVALLLAPIANKLPKNPPQPEGEAFPVLPPTPKPSKGCC